MATDEKTTPDGGSEDSLRDVEATATTGRRVAWLPWGIALLAVITAIVTTVQWRSLASDAAVREDVAAAAGQFMTTLTNWDASDGLQDTREALRDAGTGRFLDEVDTLFGGPLGADLESAQATSTGEVEDVFTQRIEGDEAVVLAVAIQRLESTLSDEPDVTVRSAKLTLERTDGVWLVENVELLSDSTPTAEVTDPTPDPEPESSEEAP